MNELAARFEMRYRGGATVAADLRLALDAFSVLVLFGPSGSGKTTILRALAGLESPQQGTIRFGGETWFDATARVNLRPQQRGVGYLFQQYSLFPHLTVRENIAFGIGQRSSGPSDRVDELVSRFDLTGLEGRLPRQISGGQQQRVALARTLACGPRLLLLDEPLASLDQNLRDEVRGQLRDWLASFSLPTILVTHDRSDALALGDTIVVLSDGRTLQQGTVAEVFSDPRDEAVARIVGIETIIEGRIAERDGELVALDLGGVRLWATGRAELGSRALACVRGEDVTLSRQSDAATSARNQLRGRITSLVPEGPLVRVLLDCGFRLTALVTRPASAELSLRVGDEVFASIKATAIHVTPR